MSIAMDFITSRIEIKLKEIIIVGAGPAGLTSAIELKDLISNTE